MRRLAVAAITAVLLSFAPQASAAPCCAQGWHWRRAHNPFVINLVLSVTNAWQPQVNSAAAEWSTSDKFDMVSTPGSTSLRARRNCAMTSGAVHVCNANYGATGWAGLTEAAVRGGHILRMRVRLNDAETPMTYRRLVSCHELGHSAGLGHNSRNSSCMKPGAGSRPHPDATDYAELDVIYRHLDGATPTTADTKTHIVRVYWQ